MRHIGVLAPWIIVLLVAGPVAAGLIGTLLPAFGYLPAIGAREFTLEAFRAYFEAPGAGTSLILSIWTGLAGAVLALLLAMTMMAALAQTRVWRFLHSLTPLFLAVPHAAMAIGFAFLIAPSGLFLRIGYQALGLGDSVPPDLLIVNDPNGLALTVGLALRETPFLLFALMAASHHLDIDHQSKIARSLGYRSIEVWLFVILPQLYRRIRLPMIIVIAYGATNADIALVLGPTSPPTSTVLILQWFRDPDLANRLLGTAGALILTLTVVAAVLAWLAIEHAVGKLRQSLVNAGLGGMFGPLTTWSGRIGTVAVFGVGMLSLAVLAIWSVTGRWRFPDLLPELWSLESWMRSSDDLLRAIGTTLSIAMITSLIALILTVLWFENRRDQDREGTSSLKIAFLTVPLLIPQISFVFGLQIAMIRLDLDATYLGVILAHLVFAIPYTALLLVDPYHSLDPRFARTALSLGRHPWAVFWRIKLPLLARPIAFVWAIGFSVSCAQYLTTLFVGQGRVVTLTLESLALIGAGDRRVTAVMAIVLALLPLSAFVVAALLPRLLWPRLHVHKGAG